MSATPSMDMAFFSATDQYLIMEPEVRAKLRDLLKYDKEVATDGFAELICVSHVYADLTDMTEQAIQAVLIKVLEYAAKVMDKGNRLVVGNLCGTREPAKLDGVDVTRENIFVPVKII